MLKYLPLPLTAVAIAVAVSLPASTSASGTPGTGVGTFAATCAFSHTLNDDPIVFPRGPGASPHSHDFFGATTTDAFSTPESVSQGPTSCVRTDSVKSHSDSSAYWVPTLYVNDQRVQASQMGAYYKSEQRDYQAIKPFPKGLMMIAGTSAGAPSEIGGIRVWDYRCPGGTAVAGSDTTAPTCAAGSLEMSIRFPDCWDGINLDSPNHKSHMAYSRKASPDAVRTCPSSHPVLVPMLELIWRFPTTGGPSTRLTSGPVNTAHADFVNGWDQSEQELLVRRCLNVDTYCGGGDPPSATTPPPPAPEPAPAPAPAPAPVHTAPKPTHKPLLPLFGRSATTKAAPARRSVQTKANKRVSKQTTRRHKRGSAKH